MDSLIFLDTETTGNEPKKDRLVQVCYKIGEEIKTEYFKPPLPMSVKAMSVTHITNRMLEDKPPFIGSAMARELTKLLAEKVLVAHNAIFDIAMLTNEGLTVPRFIDTLRVARHLDPECKIPEYNLQFLRYYLDLEVEAVAHDAAGDVLVLEAVFARLFKKIRESEKSDEAALEKMIEISSKPTLFKTMIFGKHKGKSMEEVAATDRAYLEWLLAQKMQTEESEEDWIYTLKHYLE